MESSAERVEKATDRLDRTQVLEESRWTAISMGKEACALAGSRAPCLPPIP